MPNINFCRNCKKYTLEQRCPKCRRKTVNTEPVEFEFDKIHGCEKK
ncbi:MAG: hypothetical protein KAQ92_08210 [Candidatus Aenigmarchaeota archaeon]|nr:hypothetical protein [Candidatus Aenigmarchaeota archaeon]